MPIIIQVIGDSNTADGGYSNATVYGWPYRARDALNTRYGAGKFKFGSADGYPNLAVSGTYLDLWWTGSAPTANLNNLLAVHPDIIYINEGTNGCAIGDGVTPLAAGYRKENGQLTTANEILPVGQSAWVDDYESKLLGLVQYIQSQTIPTKTENPLGRIQVVLLVPSVCVDFNTWNIYDPYGAKTKYSGSPPWNTIGVYRSLKMQQLRQISVIMVANQCKIPYVDLKTLFYQKGMTGQEHAPVYDATLGAPSYSGGYPGGVSANGMGYDGVHMAEAATYLAGQWVSTVTQSVLDSNGYLQNSLETTSYQGVNNMRWLSTAAGNDSWAVQRKKF